MSMLTEGEIIKMMRDEYHKRLSEVLGESEMIDDRGNMVVGKDLKIRHKDTQYEYTVDDVEENPETGELEVTLNLPETPRVDPPASQGTAAIHINKVDRYKIKGQESDDNEIFIVDQEEFEKEYEVK